MSSQDMKDPTQFFPMPVALVTTHSAEHGDNVMGIGYIGFACWQPPILALGINTARYSGRVIQETREFVAAIPGADSAMSTDYCGFVSGSYCDKLALSGFTTRPATCVKAPLLQECLLNMECRLRDIILLGSHSLFLGEVVATHTRGPAAAGEEPTMVLLQRRYMAARELIMEFGASRGNPPG